MENNVKNIADNAMRMQSALVLANRDELEKEQEVFNQLESLLSKETKKLASLEKQYSLHPDITNIVSAFKKQEARVNEIMAARELSYEAILQFKINLETLGETVE